MKKSLLLVPLLAVLSNVMFGSAQRITTSWTTSVAHAYAAPDLLQTRRQISVVSFPDPRNDFRGSRAQDKSVLWKLHLALQLVKHRELDQQQVRVILDLISLSRPEFFTPAAKTKADDALESLRRRAFGAFPHNQATELFGNIVDAKYEADLLKMYYDISALPLKNRKASFRNASANDKSGLWKTHLALFLVKRPELNEWQKAVILAAISLATPEYFATRSTDSAWKAKVREPSRALEQQILNAFSLEDGAKIFATLGDSADLAQSSSASVFLKINYKPLDDSGPYQQWANSRFGNQDLELEQSASCGCSVQSDWCSFWRVCSPGSCSSAPDGCGTLWNHPCNGVCR